MGFLFAASTHLGSFEASLKLLGSTDLFKLLIKHTESAVKQEQLTTLFISYLAKLLRTKSWNLLGTDVTLEDLLRPSKFPSDGLISTLDTAVFSASPSSTLLLPSSLDPKLSRPGVADVEGIGC
ncbi:hypothetical protein Hanom_Chr00s056098g01782861 [Helianthus anomalus]